LHSEKHLIICILHQILLWCYYDTFLMMIMSKGWDYVSELRLPTGLMFIPQIIYLYGETRWNGIDRGKHLIRPPELSRNPTSSHLEANQKKLDEENYEFSFRNILFHASY
jgi:hypothetical protein